MFYKYKESFLNFLKYEKRYSSHTINSYSIDLEQFFSYLTDINVIEDKNNIDYQVIRGWIIELSDAKNSTKTINRKIACLKSFFKYLMREKIISQNPASRIKSPKVQKRLPVFVEENHLELLLENVEFQDSYSGIRDKLILELFYATGIRLSELINLKHSDISLYENTIKVLGKGNKVRIIPFHKNVTELINKYNNIKKFTFSNTSKDDNSFFLTDFGDNIYPVFVQRLVKKYLNMVSNADKKSPHVLRHSFATHMLNHGAELNSIKEMLGHSSLAATEIYTHNSLEKLKNIFQKAHPKA